MADGSWSVWMCMRATVAGCSMARARICGLSGRPAVREETVAWLLRLPKPV